MNTKILLLLILFGVGCHALFGQSQIDGRVLNEKNVGMEGAEILLFRDSTLVTFTTTNADGRFVFVLTEASVYELRVTFLGYEPYVMNKLTVTNNQQLTLPDIVLTPSSVSLKEVVVADAVPLIEKIGTKTRINVRGNNEIIGDNVSEIIGKLPNVQYNNLTGDLLLNGRSKVQLQIDGTPLLLSTADALSLIGGMSAQDILSVELDSAPSSKNDASGGAGIINIITLKSLGWGNKFELRGSAGGWNYGRWRGEVAHTYSKKGFRISSGYSYSDLNTFGRNNTSIIFPNGNENRNEKFNPYSLNQHNLRTAFNWEASKKTTITLSAIATSSVRQDRTSSVTSLFNPNPSTDSTLELSLVEDRTSNKYFANLNVTHRLDRKSDVLSVTVDAVGYDIDSRSLIISDLIADETNTSTAYLETRNDLPTDLNIISGKLDYETTAWNFPFSFGAKFSFINNQTSALFEQRSSLTEDFEVNPIFTNQVDYNEHISAVYVNFAPVHLNTTFNIGVRAEYTNNRIEQASLNTLNRNRLDIFPSISGVSHLIGEHYLTLAYDRRIDRQLYEDLNQFTYFLDNFTWFQGNPFLDPQLTNTFQIQYSYKGAYQAILLHSNTKNVFTSPIAYAPNIGERNTIGRIINTPALRMSGLNIIVPEQHGIWSMTNVFGIFYANYELDLSETQPRNADWYVSIQSSQSINFKSPWQLSGNLFFQSSFPYSFYRFDPIFAADIALQRRILKGKGNVRLSLTDIAYLNRYKGKSNKLLANIELTGLEQWESRLFRVSMSYNFGNTKVENTESKEVSKSEQGRVKRE